MDFQAAVHQIQRAYDDLGYELGWRFLYSPAATFSPSTRLVFAGLNPGGSQYEAPLASVEGGNAYRTDVEDWGIHRLQDEVTLFFDRLAERLDLPGETLMDSTLTTNFCPFRSQSWKDLPHRRKAIAFSSQLWGQILSHLNPAVLIGMGAETRDRFRRLLLGQGYQVEKSWYIPTGWWKTAHKLDTLRLDARRLLLVGIPHLSRFRVISGQKYTTSTNELLDTIARRLNT